MTTEEVEKAMVELHETLATLRTLQQHVWQRRTGTMTTMSMRNYGINDAINGIEMVIRDFHQSKHLW
jgi:hypothetical protein